MKSVKIIGTGSYAPSKIVTNSDLSKIVDTNDEWISSRTGIRERRITTGEDTSVLSTKAALEAIKNANIDPLDIDLIVVGTASPDKFIPSTACLVQAEIGAENATCFDISAACTGFIYALNIGTQFIKTGQCKTALVIGAEVLSKIVDWSDRSTCVLFGDGAGAAILQSSHDENGILSIYTGSDGRNAAEFLGCSAVPVRNPFIKSAEKQESLVTMNGKDIFRFGTKIIPKCIEEVFKEQDCTIEDIKYIVPHQANMRIIDSAAKRLEIDSDKFYMNLDRYGNTSAASIPLALNEMARNGLLHRGDKIILVGFGGGLTFGAALIEWMID
ncbi:beta-ketoacyl-ACP synthase III [Clostridium pasteurianum]|uniref:Beta-ketoacyl-[acyl-carrier-protein] synthase III n=1 Tax=Clostridium pasteurianum BC1 TaxID=86416 RepID=R4KCV7_CLOPA|nr:beta-ketoacyl-ACP synthase III [Clostridium pasteurianum]AGK99496.1 3-oxoacyl-(acyl-carrier-protein) synthase III [Clostridium pasteurianum BC1]